MNIRETIQEILRANLKIARLEVIDDSPKHQGHPEAVKSVGGHFKLLIVSDDFVGKPLVARHKRIYDLLKGKIGRDIHALAIQTFTLAEFMKRGRSY